MVQTWKGQDFKEFDTTVIRNANDIISLVLEAAWRRRYLICIPMVLLPLVAVFIADFATKNYRTHMSLLVQEPGKLNPFLEDFALSPNLKERMAPLLALLKSEHVLGEVLQDLGEISTDTEEKDRKEKIEELSNSINARLIGNEVIRLSITGSTPDGLANKLEVVSKRFIERIVAPERSSVEGSEKFLGQQLIQRRKQLEIAEQKLSAFKVENATNLPEIYRANVTRLSSLNDQLDVKLIELSSAEASMEDLKKRLSGMNPLIGQLEEQIVTLSSELVSLKARYTNRHSSIQNTQARLDRLRTERTRLLQHAPITNEEEINRLYNLAAGTSGMVNDQGQSPFLVSQMMRLQDAQSLHTSLKREVEQLRAKITELSEGMARFGPTERKMQALERNIRIAQELYEKLAERHEMARVTGALGKFEAPERVKVIDAPIDPLAPETPGKFVFLLGGLFGGLLLGAGLATVSETLDPTVRSLKELEHETELPVLSRLSYIALPSSVDTKNNRSTWRGPYTADHPHLTGDTTLLDKLVNITNVSIKWGAEQARKYTPILVTYVQILFTKIEPYARKALENLINKSK